LTESLRGEIKVAAPFRKKKSIVDNIQASMKEIMSLSNCYKP